MVKIISFFSPKGGSGTSVLLTNIAIYLAQKGKKILLLDGAYNGGTLHNYLNIPDFAVSQVVPSHFSLLPITLTNYQNLNFFSNLRSKNPNSLSETLLKWDTEIKQSDFDYILIDLGSFISNDLFSTMDLVDFNILVTTPDPIGIAKTNYFLKNLFKHKLNLLEDKFDLTRTVQNLKKNKNDFLFTQRNLSVLLSETVHADQQAMIQTFQKQNLGIIINKTKLSSDSNIKKYYKYIINNYFGIDFKLVEEVPYSEVFLNSLMQKSPLVTNEKSFEFSEIFAKIISKISDVLNTRTQMSLKTITPLNYYEIVGIDKGSTIMDIKNRYEELKELYSTDNYILKGLYDDKSLYIYRALIDSVYVDLIDSETRREYDIEFEKRQSSLKKSFPESFNLREILKKYNKQNAKKDTVIQRDIFGRKTNFAGENTTDTALLDIDSTNEMLQQMMQERDEINGKFLKDFREKLNVSLLSISEQTRISKYIIEAIEEEISEKLPAEIYIRGFLTNYCKALKINPQNIKTITTNYLAQIKSSRQNTGEIDA